MICGSISSDFMYHRLEITYISSDSFLDQFCDSFPCQNNGNCENFYILGKFVQKCICRFGFTGQFCENSKSFTSYFSTIIYVIAITSEKYPLLFCYLIYSSKPLHFIGLTTIYTYYILLLFHLVLFKIDNLS